MKKVYLSIALVFWVFVTVAVVAATVYVAKGGLIRNTVKTAALVKNEDVSLGNARDIIIEVSSHDLEIRKTAGSRIIISQYGDPETSDEDLFSVSANDNQVRIYIDDFKNTFSFDFNKYNEKLVVEIPEHFNGSLDARTSSGSLKTEDRFTLKDVRLVNSSGGIHVGQEIIADTLILNTSSGGIDIDASVTANTIEATSSSGGIQITEANVEKYDFKCSSGAIKVDQVSGSGSVIASSGSISLSLVDPKDSVTVRTSSGAVNIDLKPSSLEFTLDARTGSGKIKTNFDADKNEEGSHATAKIGSSPTVDIKVTTSSGSINIEK